MCTLPALTPAAAPHSSGPRGARLAAAPGGMGCPVPICWLSACLCPSAEILAIHALFIGGARTPSSEPPGTCNPRCPMPLDTDTEVLAHRASLPSSGSLCEPGFLGDVDPALWSVWVIYAQFTRKLAGTFLIVGRHVQLGIH